MTIARPGRQFGIGQMRERVTIQEATSELSDGGRPVRTWLTKYANQPAKWLQVSGGESIRGRQIEAGVVAVFTIRARDGIGPRMQLVHRGVTYGIGSVHPVGGRDRYLDIHCKAVK
jgi:SPP1 family predicted phage head-tail adaptor